MSFQDLEGLYSWRGNREWTSFHGITEDFSFKGVFFNCCLQYVRLLKRKLRSLLKLHIDHFYSEGWRHYYNSSCSGLCKNQSRFMQCDNMALLLVLLLCALQCSNDGVEMISCQILSSSSPWRGAIVGLTSGHDGQEPVLRALQHVACFSL